jgi:hypothetical protein
VLKTFTITIVVDDEDADQVVGTIEALASDITMSHDIKERAANDKERKQWDADTASD